MKHNTNVWIVVLCLALLLATLACQAGIAIENAQGTYAPIPTAAPTATAVPPSYGHAATAVISSPGYFMVSQLGAQWYLHVDGKRIPCRPNEYGGVTISAGKVYGHYAYDVPNTTDCAFTVYPAAQIPGD